MRQLIDRVRTTLPFDMPQAQMCSDLCSGCSQKLLAYLDMELADWERCLADGQRPSFGDIERLAKLSRSIYTVVKRNGLIS